MSLLMQTAFPEKIIEQLVNHEKCLSARRRLIFLKIQVLHIIEFVTEKYNPVALFSDFFGSPPSAAIKLCCKIVMV